MKITFLITAILFSSSVFAGMYKCTSDSKIEKTEEKIDIVTFQKSKPYIMSYALDERTNADKKIPYLIYYAMDSEEPFMRYSVNYEIASLRESCEKSKNVNFVAILNSLYVAKNEIIVCKDTVFRSVKLSDYPETDKLLKEKRDLIRAGTNSEIFDYNVKFKKVNQEAFYQFPLAHPDFFYDLITLVKENEDIFPSDKYLPFLNLKSHGSSTNVLSGMHPCQIEAKKKSQEEMMEALLTTEEINYLATADFQKNLSKVDAILLKLGLGFDVAALTEEDLGQNYLGRSYLGRSYLGRSYLGRSYLGEAISGLGASAGLGAQYSFGLTHNGMSSVLSHLFNADQEKLVGFVMLESCDTNRDNEFYHTNLHPVLGVYSAKSSLWYRNLNWWTIMEKANGSSFELIRQLTKYTAMIDNIVVKE